MTQKLNDNQVWALSETGRRYYTTFTDDMGIDSDLAFEMVLNILGEAEAFNLEQADVR